MLIEVNSVSPKATKLLINLDHVAEIAPLVRGGCAITFTSQEGGSVKIINVSNEYTEFKQFALETVSVSDIAKKTEKLRGYNKSANIKNTNNGVELDAPSFGQADPT